MKKNEGGRDPEPHATTWLVRFETDEARDQFVRALSDPSFRSIEVEVCEFFPDAILRRVHDADLCRMHKLAPNARFMPNFKHDLF